MPTFQAKRRVAVPTEVTFSVAADVGSYAQFLPLLKRATIVGKPVEQGGVKTFNAELEVGYKKLNIREVFMSKVISDANSKTVTATSDQGPFKSLKTVWTIAEANGQSDVTVSIEYSLRNFLVQLALSAAMDAAVAKIMTAFENRAVALHKASSTNKIA